MADEEQIKIRRKLEAIAGAAGLRIGTGRTADLGLGAFGPTVSSVTTTSTAPRHYARRHPNPLRLHENSCFRNRERHYPCLKEEVKTKAPKSLVKNRFGPRFNPRLRGILVRRR
jgi:hypothetical protein